MVHPDVPDLVDEVDEHDQPTGRKLTRTEVCGGNNDVLHRCIAVYVFAADDGRVYVQTHKKSGLYDHSVGGHVDAGENYATAAKREAEEELGIRDIQLHELGVGVRSHEQGRQHMFGIYECFAGPEWKFVPNDEVDEITPMTIAEAVALANDHPEQCTQGFINVLRFYIKRKNLPFIVR
jgi:16S rRNA (adenine1518-N6/adenine1519-N6)-dimethyltransferase